MRAPEVVVHVDSFALSTQPITKPDTISDCTSIFSGVPQGSVLNLLDFSYIYTLPCTISDKACMYHIVC